MFVITIIHISIQAQSVYGTYQKTFYGTNCWLNAECIKHTFDGGFIITGVGTTPTSGYYDIVLIKTDSLGNLQWSKIYGDGPQPGLNYARDVCQVVDSGFVIAGSTEIGNGGDYLIKTDKNGNYEWSCTYGNNYIYSMAREIIPTYDNQIAVISHNSGDMSLVKINLLNGNILWMKRYGVPIVDGAEKGVSLVQLPDHGFALLGSTTPNEMQVILDYYLVRTDSLGNQLWGKTYGGSGYEEPYKIIRASDGGLVLCGNSNSWSGSINPYIIKTDSTGVIQWSKSYSFGNDGNFYAKCIRESNEGGFAVACSTTEVNNALYAMAMKLDSAGNFLWARKYGNSTPVQCNFQSLLPMPDGGFALTGSSDFPDPYYGLYLVKTDSNGVSGCDEFNVYPVVTDVSPAVSNFGSSSTGSVSQMVVTTIHNFLSLSTFVHCSTLQTEINENVEWSVQIFPNPTSGEVTIECNKRGNYLVNITDIYGRVLKILSFTGEETALDLGCEPPGIYCICLVPDSSNEIFHYKVIRE